MHKIKIEIIYAAGFKLAFEQRSDFFVSFEIRTRKLVCKNIAFAGVALNQCFAYCGLAFLRKITVRRVEIVKAGIQKAVDHFAELGNINLFVLHRQTHTAESKIFLYLGKNAHKSLRV